MGRDSQGTSVRRVLRVMALEWPEVGFGLRGTVMRDVAGEDSRARSWWP